MSQNAEEFITQLTASQPAIYACILSLLPDRTVAHDILQETNVTLWRKADDFEPGTNFLAWASRIARYHVLNHRRTAKRNKLIFDDSLVAELSERQDARSGEMSRYSDLLRGCLEKLPTTQRSLIEARYAAGVSVKELAESRGQTSGSLSQMLYRIREALLNCISGQLGEVAS